MTETSPYTAERIHAVREALQQLTDQVHTTAPEEQMALLDELRVLADQLKEGGPRAYHTRLADELRALRDCLIPQVTFDARLCEEFCIPIQLVVQTPLGGVERVFLVPLAEERGAFEVGGIRSQNNRFEVTITQIHRGGDANPTFVSSPICASIYNTVLPFVPIDPAVLGPISNRWPLLVTAHSFGNPSSLPFLHLTFFCRPYDPESRKSRKPDRS